MIERAITVLSDVKDLAELLNGARIDHVRINSSGLRMRLELDLTRAMVEAAREVRQGLFTRRKTPWIKGRLTLNQILDVSVQHGSDIPPENVPLLECEAVPGGYQLTLTSPGGLQFQLVLEQLEGKFTDIGSPIESP